MKVCNGAVHDGLRKVVLSASNSQATSSAPEVSILDMIDKEVNTPPSENHREKSA